MSNSADVWITTTFLTKTSCKCCLTRDMTCVSARRTRRRISMTKGILIGARPITTRCMLIDYPKHSTMLKVTRLRYVPHYATVLGWNPDSQVFNMPFGNTAEMQRHNHGNVDFTAKFARETLVIQTILL